ncbi:hypothetical protein EON65_16945 [archaeon]|nr:MAG: hypothetical protein EON65_16945 [archaeon]
MTWHPDAATSSVFATLSFNFIVAVGCMVVFEYLRNYQLDIYSPKLRKKPSRSAIPKPGTGLFGWILPVWRASDDEVLRIAGLDAYVMLRHLKMCFKICVACSFGGLILLAVYYTAPGDDEVFGICKFSMANVLNNGRRLWAPFVFVYLFTFSFLYLIDAEYQNFAMIRARYLQGGEDNGMPAQMNYSVIVENIPEENRTSPQLKLFFESLFPNEVLYSYVAISMKKLEHLVQERNVLLGKLEDSIAVLESTKVRPRVFVKKGVIVPAYGKQGLDAIDFISDQISIASAEIADLQAEARNAELGNVDASVKLEKATTWNKITDSTHGIAQDVFKAVPVKQVSKITKMTGDLNEKLITSITDFHTHLTAATGFVTFGSKRAQAVAVGLPILSATYPDVQVNSAPAPSDIIWNNLSASTVHTETMSYLTAAGYYTGLLFWTVVIAFIAAISNLTYLSEYLPFLNSLSPSAYAVLQGILPVVIMMIFLSLVPYAMQLISTLIERRKTISAVQEQVFKWYAAFMNLLMHNNRYI